MGKLVSWLGGIFSGIVSFFAQFVSKRLAINLAVIAALVGLTVSFYNGIQLAIAGVSYAMPSSVAIGASWLVPSNLDTCISVMLGARVMRWVYEWQAMAVKYKAWIT